MKIRTTAAGICMLLLAACTTVGTKFDISKLDHLHPGTSTVSDAVALLGQPTAESTYPNNDRLLQWQYARGTLVGGSAAHAAILFDASGKMLRVTQRTSIK